MEAASHGEKVWTRKEGFRAAIDSHPELKEELLRINSLESYWGAHRARQRMEKPSKEEVDAYLLSARKIMQTLIPSGQGDRDLEKTLQSSWRTF